MWLVLACCYRSRVVLVGCRFDSFRFSSFKPSFPCFYILEMWFLILPRTKLGELLRSFLRHLTLPITSLLMKNGRIVGFLASS